MATAPTPDEVRTAQQYLATKPLKISPHRLAASSKELGKSFDETLSFLRSLTEGQTNQDEQMKRRINADAGAIP